MRLRTRPNRMQRTRRMLLGCMKGVSGAGPLIRDVRRRAEPIPGGFEQKQTKRTKGPASLFPSFPSVELREFIPRMRADFFSCVWRGSRLNSPRSDQAGRHCVLPLVRVGDC